jgi:cyclophilin family peptidyl-prolyl cis-trans isomerase
MKIKLFAVAALALFAVWGCKNSGKKEQQQVQQTQDTVKTMEKQLAFDPATLPEEPVFEVVTTAGTFRIKLYKDTPKHRDNFVKLASENFYDGILFHRVIKGFMVQAGDPLTKDTTQMAAWGTGGPGYTIPAEILPVHKHKKGALAAARRGDAANPKRESSGSQFYIVENAGTCASLDGDYSVFGETISGLDVIDKIASVPTSNRDVPVTPVKIISIKPVL